MTDELALRAENYELMANLTTDPRLAVRLKWLAREFRHDITVAEFVRYCDGTEDPDVVA